MKVGVLNDGFIREVGAFRLTSMKVLSLFVFCSEKFQKLNFECLLNEIAGIQLRGWFGKKLEFSENIQFYIKETLKISLQGVKNSHFFLTSYLNGYNGFLEKNYTCHYIFRFFWRPHIEFIRKSPRTIMKLTKILSKNWS